MTGYQIPDLVMAQSALLDNLFGGAAFEIVGADDEACTISTSWVEVKLTYDRRDQWVSTELMPLLVPPDISNSYPEYLWLKFCDVETATPRKGALDEQKVIDALTVIQPLVQLFKDGLASRDACRFVKGYSYAYTEWAAGKWK